MEAGKWFVLAVAVIMTALTIMFKNKKILFSSCAALLIVFTGIIFPNAIFSLPEDLIAQVPSFSNKYSFSSHMYSFVHSVWDLVDWTVILLVLGSMFISAVLVKSNGIKKIAGRYASKKSASASLILLMVFSALLSTVVQNVAVIIVSAPIFISLCREFKISPVPSVVVLTCVCAFMGTATLTGDVSSMIMASHLDFSFADFFVRKTGASIFVISLLATAALCFLYYFIYAGKCTAKVEIPAEDGDGKVSLLILILMVAGLFIISFIPLSFRFLSGVYVFVLGVVSLVWFWLYSKKSNAELKALLKSLNWETVIYLFGIYIVFGALNATGLLKDFAMLILDFTGGSKIWVYVTVCVLSLLACIVMDNLSYLILMLHVVSIVSFELGFKNEILMFALLIFSCVGSCLNPFGSLVNSYACVELKKEGIAVKKSEWLKIEIPFVILGALVSGFVMYFV